MTDILCTECGARLDVFLADETTLTRSHIKKLIDGGKVYINGVAARKAGQSVKVGEHVSFEDEVESDEVVPQNIPLDIIYDDSQIAVINKQRGLVVHPGAGNRDGTLVNALTYLYGDGLANGGGAARAGIVHRLDKDTTGLMVIAKTNDALVSLSAQFSARTVKKQYVAILDGILKNDRGVIDAPIARDKNNRLKMAVDKSGREAVTGYEAVERFSRNTLTVFRLFTGRMHQIRVHAAYIRNPVSCDALYGGRSELGAGGQLLHSFRLELDHPTTGERMNFIAPLPRDFEKALETLDSRIRNVTDLKEFL